MRSRDGRCAVRSAAYRRIARPVMDALSSVMDLDRSDAGEGATGRILNISVRFNMLRIDSIELSGRIVLRTYHLMTW
jgi:hypothetical protein